MAKEFAISADGHVIKKGKTFYYGVDKVKIIDVFPANVEPYRRVLLSRDRLVAPDWLMANPSNEVIS